MRLLIFHMRYAPDPTGTGPLVTELCQGLAGLGEDVTVITSLPHYGRQEAPFPRVPARAVERGVRVMRTWGFPWAPGSLLGRTADYLAYMLLAAWHAARARRPDLIVCIAPPITVAVSGWATAAVHGVPMVFCAQDIWPDGLVGMGRLRPGWLLTLLRALERWVYARAVGVSVVSEGMKENLQAKGVAAGRIVVIPNWADPQEILPGPKANGFRRELGLEGRFVVLFAGNLGYASGLEAALHAAASLADMDQVVFVFVGEGSAKPGLVRLAGRLGLANVRFVPTQPRERLSEVLGSADVGLVTLRKGMGAVSVPSKMYSILASGRPVLAAVPQESEVKRLLEDVECGVWVPPDDPEALAQEVRRLAVGPVPLETWGRTARRYAEQHLSPSAAIAGYRRWFYEAAGATPPA